MTERRKGVGSGCWVLVSVPWLLPSFRPSVTLPYYVIVSGKSIWARQAGALLMYVRLEFP